MPRLYLLGERGKIPPIVEAAYQAAGKPKLIRTSAHPISSGALPAWLLQSRAP